MSRVAASLFGLLQEVKINSSIEPLKHQFQAIEKANKKDFGVIVAPPGSGKTVIALKIIEHKKTACTNPCPQKTPVRAMGRANRRFFRYTKEKNRENWSRQD